MDEATDYLEELKARGGARGPATFGQIWSSTWAQTGLDTIGGVGKPFLDAWDEGVAAVEAGHGGRTLGELARERKLDLVENWGSRIRTLGQLIDEIPDEDARKRAEKFKDVRQRASDKAHELERNAAETAETTFGFTGNTLAYAAGMSRQAIDPINLAANFLPFGGPLTGRLVPMIAKAAAGGAAAQALVEPFIENARAELGLDYGAVRAAWNIAGAAAGGAAFSSLLRAGAWGLRVASRGMLGQDINWLKPDMPASGDFRVGETVIGSVREFYSRVRGIEPEDLEALARTAQRDEVIASTRPGVEQTRQIDEASAALESGKPVTTVEPIAGHYNDDVTRSLIRPGGARLEVRPKVVELGDLVVSHNIEGQANPSYPAELQPRDRAAPASRTWVAEKAAELEPALLTADQPTAGVGAPVIGPDGVVESGNGRVMLIARAYDRHPEQAAAYRAMLEQQGYDLTDMKFPVLVRERQGELPMAQRAALALEANISPTAGMSTRERAIADAKGLDASVLGYWRGGSLTSVDNAQFVRAFADRLIAPEERPQFVDKDNRLSAEGVRRVEAALVQKAWGAEDIVTALYEAANSDSRAILGAMADTAPTVARLRTAIDEGRVPASADPTPHMLEAYRIVDRARGAGQRVGEALDQVDLERGAVPEEVRAAARLYFRDEALRQPAGRATVAERINASIERAIEHQNAIGDLFGVEPSAKTALRVGRLAGEPEDLAIIPDAVDSELAIPPQRLPNETDKEFAKRVVDKRDPPAELPEQHELYFKIDSETQTVPITDLVSAKTAEENKQGGANGPKRMAAAAAGELERRDPITVSPLEGQPGKYLVVDGNGTLTSVQAYGWQQMPVKVIEATPAEGVANTATRASRPSLFADSNLVQRTAIETETFNAQRDQVALGQPFKTLDEAIANAPERQAELIGLLRGATEKHGGTLLDPGVKLKRDRMEWKVAHKYAGEPRRLTDLVRGGVVVSSPEMGDAIAAELARVGYVIDEGWKIYTGGYFDRKLEVVLPDGTMTEVQIRPEEVHHAKEELGGEAIYEKVRQYTTDADKRRGEAELIAFWAPIIGQMGEVWSSVMGGSPKAVSASLYTRLASLSESSSPSPNTISPAGTSAQPSAVTAKAELSPTTATVEPQANQRAGIEAPPTKDIGILGDPVKAQEFERTLQELGSDFEVWFPDGTKRSARELLEVAQNDARAAAELEACIGEAAALEAAA